MAQGASRVMQQRRLRAELRRLRDNAGHTQKFVAQGLDWSLSKIIRIENGAVPVSASDVRALLHFYGVTDQAHTEDLLEVARTKGESWWDPYKPYYKQQFLDFLAYEDSAATLRQFIAFAVPGLLQTEAYMRTVFEGYLEDQESIDRGTEVRLRRQKVLSPAREREFQFVIDEGALHRWVGGPEVIRAQLEHLRTLARQPNISVRIVPFTAGMYPGMRGSFTVFEFSEDEDPIVNLESPHIDALIRDDLETTSDFVETFYRLDDFATREGDLDKVLDSMIDRMRLET